MNKVMYIHVLRFALLTLIVSTFWLESANTAAPLLQTQAIDKELMTIELPRDPTLENLDYAITRVTDAMGKSALVRGKIAGSIRSVEPRILLSPTNTGLSSDQLAMWVSIVTKSLKASPRYGSSDIKPPLMVVVMPKSKIVRVRIDSPTPTASEQIEATPLIIYGWICPDQQTALALYWLRRQRLDLLNLDNFNLAEQSILAEKLSEPSASKPEKGEPGESNYWQIPRSHLAVELFKGDKNLPLDRFTIIRNNMVIEASTVEFTWDKDANEWPALQLKEYFSDVMRAMNIIDAEMIKIYK